MKKLIEIAQEHILAPYDTSTNDYVVITEAQLQATFDDYCKQSSEVKNTLEEIMYAMRTKAANNIVIKDTTLESFADEIEKVLAAKPAILKD